MILWYMLEKGEVLFKNDVTFFSSPSGVDPGQELLQREGVVCNHE